jgi:hypothetical protein
MGHKGEPFKHGNGPDEQEACFRKGNAENRSKSCLQGVLVIGKQMGV